MDKREKGNFFSIPENQLEEIRIADSEYREMEQLRLEKALQSKKEREEQLQRENAESRHFREEVEAVCLQITTKRETLRKEKNRLKTKKYREKNRDKVNAKARERYQGKKEYNKDRRKKYYLENIESERNKRLEYYEENKVLINEKRREKYQEDKKRGNSLSICSDQKSCADEDILFLL